MAEVRPYTGFERRLSNADGEAFCVPDLYRDSYLPIGDPLSLQLGVSPLLKSFVNVKDGLEFGGPDFEDGIGIDVKQSLLFEGAQLFEKELSQDGALGFGGNGLGRTLEDLDLEAVEEEDVSLYSLDLQDGHQELVQSQSQGQDQTAHDAASEEDIWRTAAAIPEPDHAKRSWDRFYDKCFQDPKHFYLSEAGDKVFDALLSTRSQVVNTGGDSKATDGGIVMESDVVLSSLGLLAVGRQSLLYNWDENGRTLIARQPGVRMSGYSLESFKSLVQSLLRVGNQVRQLLDFSNETHISPLTMAFSAALRPTLASLEIRIGESFEDVRSLVHLQSTVEEHKMMIDCIAHMLLVVRSAHTDEIKVANLLDFITAQSEMLPQLRPFLYGLFKAATTPWVDSLASFVGLRGDGLCPEELVPSSDDLQFPPFVRADVSEMILETRSSLTILRIHEPDHVASKSPSTVLDLDNDFQWQFKLQDIERITARAQQHELNMRTLMESLNEDQERRPMEMVQTKTSRDGIPCQEGLVWNTVSTLPRSTFESPLDSYESFSTDDSDCYKDLFFPPPSTLFNMSFMPLITAQARLINRACLRLILTTHDLPSHLSILHRFLTLSDGVFASRLSEALFDPNTDGSTEHQPSKQLAGRTGLNLGTRNTWPPASPELRLALTGILTESYFTRTPTNHPRMARRDLPGGMSFAIRDLSEDEIQKCMDPHGIEALDFLKISYQPPAPLDHIMTAESLTRYDAIFKMLLRVLRVQFVVNQLPRKATPPGQERGRGLLSQRIITAFRIESQHFVACVGAYMFDSISTHWRKLQRYLETVRLSIDAEGDRDRTELNESMDGLRRYYEGFLDRMTRSLLLRKRQKEISALMDEIFGLILVLARRLSEAEATAGTEPSSWSGLFATFRKKVREFASLSRHLGSRESAGNEDWHGGLGDGAPSPLHVRLEMNDFYA